MPGSSTRPVWSPLVGYALGVAFVAAALTISLLLGPILPFSLFLGAVMLSCWFGGTRVGVFALLLSIAALTLVLDRPPFLFWTDADYPTRIVTFSISGMLLLGAVAARHRAERKLITANEELKRWAALKLVRTKRRARARMLQARFQARLEERTRLAREIHDTLLQGFTGVSLQLLATMGRTDVAPECRTALREVLVLAQKTLADARQAVWDMRPPALEGEDFVVSLRAALDRTLADTELALDYVVQGAPRALEREVETVVFRVAQEAVTNVVKHGAAHTVRVRVSFRRRSVRLVVADDGRGFVVDPALHAYAGRWGLLGMRERASQIHASLSIKSVPGEGTKIVLRVPTRPGTVLPDQGIAADIGTDVV